MGTPDYIFSSFFFCCLKSSCVLCLTKNSALSLNCTLRYVHIIFLKYYKLHCKICILTSYNILTTMRITCMWSCEPILYSQHNQFRINQEVLKL